MARDGGMELAAKLAEVLLAPEVAHLLRAGEAKIGPFHCHAGFVVPAIKQADGF